MEKLTLVLSAVAISFTAAIPCHPAPPHHLSHLQPCPHSHPIIPSCSSSGDVIGRVRSDVISGGLRGCVVVQPVATPGRIIVREAPTVIPEYVERQPIVLEQEAAPRFVFGDVSPVRLSHRSRPSVIEHFETPYVIDAFQRTNFVNHAATPVVVDHYEHPEFVRDEGLPVIYEPCECGVPAWLPETKKCFANRLATQPSLLLGTLSWTGGGLLRSFP
ncbi:unnamed protein product [Bemisia tabaci]|uniref:Uncharacterized protein n=1 Tax=Bemisia tabaci TaxID=7038 RepID=A0A9P0F597_BEMTA|nr:unnamed protein product [Bemisia tabaci]